MIVWRVSNHAILDGAGGLYASGRWHNRGHRIVYCAENPATALLETLVHLEVDDQDIPDHYLVLKVSIPDRLDLLTIEVDSLAYGWQQQAHITRAVGDRWLAERKHAMLSVPSVLVPDTRNILINPDHPDTGNIEIVDRIEHPLDPRLMV